MASAREASLINSRSRNSVLASMMRWRWKANSRRGPKKSPAASSARVAASIAVADVGAPMTVATSSSWNV